MKNFTGNLNLNNPTYMKKKPTLALAMIVKNEGESIKRCIESVKPYINEFRIVDTGSTDNTVEVLKELGIEPVLVTPESHPDLYIEVEGIKELNFSRARNLSIEGLKSDYWLWLDGDDTLVGADKLPDILEYITSAKITAVSCTYLYNVIEGQIISQHPKERILKTGMYQWEYNDKWAVHENTYPKKEFRGEDALFFADIIKVFHHKDFRKTGTRSGERNLRILRWMINQPELKDDPRVHFLIGREAYGLGEMGVPNKMELALEFSERYLEMEYTPHDAMIACLQLTTIYEGLNWYKDALKYAFECIKVKPDHPLGYVLVAKYYTLLGRNTEALKFIEDSSTRKQSRLDPAVQLDYTIQRTVARLLAENYDRLGRFRDAVAVLQDFKRTAIKDDHAQIDHDIKDLINKENFRKVKEAFVVQANLKLAQREGDKIKKKDVEKMIKDFPVDLTMSKEVIDLKRAVGIYKKHTNSIAIYCALNFEHWDPESIIKNGGGGSETAVIELASRFAKAGYDVTVYASPKKNNTVYEGVTYKTFTDINYADEFDIFISWRNPWIFKDAPIKARKKYLWLQDIMIPHDYTPELYEQLDKIIVLSPYHRQTAMHVPESKFYYTTNGINLKLIEEAEEEMEGTKREKGYCIYASSADRGLEGLVKFWPYVLKGAPHARLTWFYGWNSWNKLQDNEAGSKWQQIIIKAMKRNGVKEGGRIGKKELYKEYLKCQFWTYPLVGPAETSCITAMEAQACGAFPVTTGITALEVTQEYGIKVPLEEYPDTLIQALNSKDFGKKQEKYRKAMMKWARETFSWDRVADRWVLDLFDGYKN